MNRMKYIALTGAIAIAAMSAASQSAEADSQNSFAVKVKVDAGCTFTKPDNFVFPELKGYKDTKSVFINDDKTNGLPSPALSVGSSSGPPVTQGSNLTVTCTRGTGYTITFSGANDVVSDAEGPLPTFRKYMKSTTTSNKILYYLRPSDNLQKAIGGAYNVPKNGGMLNSGYVVDGSAVDGKPKTLSITATIDQEGWGDNPPAPGRYSDTVTIYVNF